jgi:endonuclease YncB( thermonuclease family)
MRQGASSFIANVALVVGVAATAAIAAAVIVPRHESGAGPAALMADAPGRLKAKDTIDVRPPAMPETAALPALDRLRPGTSAGPFEPLAPPMAAAASALSLAAHEQVAALTPVESVPPAALAPLRTVELDSHEVHAVPRHDEPVRPVTIVNRPESAGKAERAAPKRTVESPRPHREAAAAQVAAKEAVAPGGVNLAGPAIVTAPLELNVAGKPLRLFGVNPPASGDMCAPSADFAARSCPDVSRQALAARVGADGDVSCRVLAAGGGSALPAVCADHTGADLATYLVEHGFALADPNDMVDYSGAETQAKTAHSGLWSYR